MSKQNTSLTTFFGKGTTKKTIFSSSLVAVISFFYIYALGTFFKINVFPFQDRFTYFIQFEKYLIEENLDLSIILSFFIIWLVIAVKKKDLNLLSAAFISR